MSSTADVLWMRGVGEVCEMCLARGGVGRDGGEWMIGLGSGFTNLARAGGVLDVCLGCGGGWCRWVVGAWPWLGLGSGGVG